MNRLGLISASISTYDGLRGSPRRLLACLFLWAMPLAAHDIITTKLTFTRDISRIFANRCEACHGAQASIPLTNYEQVRPWAVAIKEQVLGRTMPPWGAVKGFGNLAPDGGLSQEEITIIAAWVIGGAPQGNPALLAKPESMSKGKAALAVQDALTIETTGTLRQAVEAAGIRPLTDKRVDSARVVARLPDGRIVPLVWLYEFDPHWSRTFTFRAPIKLPAGTVVESSAPLHFSIAQKRATTPAQGS